MKKTNKETVTLYNNTLKSIDDISQPLSIFFSHTPDSSACHIKLDSNERDILFNELRKRISTFDEMNCYRKDVIAMLYRDLKEKFFENEYLIKSLENHDYVNAAYAILKFKKSYNARYYLRFSFLINSGYPHTCHHRKKT